MTNQELFRIFDACQPSVIQVKEYLKRISGVSPFDLIFVKGNLNKITNKINPNTGELVGIVIEKTIFYIKGFEKKEVPDGQKITTDDVFAFAKKLYPKSRALPMTLENLQTLAKNREKFEDLCQMLSVFGYEPPLLQEAYLLLGENGSSTCGDYYTADGSPDGATDISSFIKNYGKIFYCESWK